MSEKIKRTLGRLPPAGAGAAAAMVPAPMAAADNEIVFRNSLRFISYTPAGKIDVLASFA